MRLSSDGRKGGPFIDPLIVLSVAGGQRTCYDPWRRIDSERRGFAMAREPTTAVVQRYLDALAGDQPAGPIVRALLDRSIQRLQLLCGKLLYRQYRRLTLPPLNVQPDEMLAAVVERLLRAVPASRPRTVRQFFALINQHMRWELNDLARRLDEQPAEVALDERRVLAPPASGSVLTADGRRMLEGIDRLSEEEREAFGLVRIQALTHGEAAEVLGVSAKTVQRRLNRSLVLLVKELDHLRPS
jgi:RNA polymerase sigma-70 factor (ECF subfamily)